LGKIGRCKDRLSIQSNGSGCHPVVSDGEAYIGFFSHVKNPVYGHRLAIRSGNLARGQERSAYRPAGIPHKSFGPEDKIAFTGIAGSSLVYCRGVIRVERRPLGFLAGSE